MTGHTSWARYRFERLARLSAIERAAFDTGQRLSRERLDRETWLAEVEGWLSRSLTAAQLGRPVESLSYPIRTIRDLDVTAEFEYGSALKWSEKSAFTVVNWRELRREATQRLLAEAGRRWDEYESQVMFGSTGEIDDWPTYELDGYGRTPDDDHYGHEHL